jgi:hypothetical protein
VACAFIISAIWEMVAGFKVSQTELMRLYLKTKTKIKKNKKDWQNSLSSRVLV